MAAQAIYTCVDAQGRRHTSFASVFIYPVVDDTIEIDVRDDDSDLLGSGLVDSFGLVEILTALEASFGITVDMQALELDDVRSVNALARYVRARRGSAQAERGNPRSDESAA